MNHLDLFSGVGMFSLAAQKAGYTTVAFAEPDKFCQRVLRKHNPTARIYDDVRDITYERLQEDGIVSNSKHDGWNEAPVYRGTVTRKRESGMQQSERLYYSPGTLRQNARPEDALQPAGIDLITGGFPCQDLSVAGKQEGIEGERSGLWSEFARIIGDIAVGQGYMPTVIVENVAALLTGDNGGWMRRVAGDISQILSDNGGGRIEGHVIPAGNADGPAGFRKLSAGAPHRRERVWIIAHPGLSEPQGRNQPQTDNHRCSGKGIQQGRESAPCDSKQKDVAYPSSEGLHQREMHSGICRETERQQIRQAASLGDEASTGETPLARRTRVGKSEPSLGLLAHGIATRLSRSRWLEEPRIGRVATGVPDRVNKLKALGNGLVHSIPLAIINSILERE